MIQQHQHQQVAQINSFLEFVFKYTWDWKIQLRGRVRYVLDHHCGQCFVPQTSLEVIEQTQIQLLPSNNLSKTSGKPNPFFFKSC